VDRKNEYPKCISAHLGSPRITVHKETVIKNFTLIKFGKMETEREKFTALKQGDYYEAALDT
jgi:hypothetical protein